VLQVQQELRVLLEPQEHKVYKALQVLKAYKVVLEDLLDLRAPSDLQAQQVL
jgi:hypothetical protein